MRTESHSTENKILEAAEQLFMEQGFDKTTTSQIAKMAGCNQALVHYYYRTKENLFEQIFEGKFRFLFTNLLSISAEETNFRDLLVKIIQTHFDFLVANRQLPSFILKELLSNPERVKALVSKIRQTLMPMTGHLEDMIKTEVAKGNIAPISAVDLLLTVASLNISMFVVGPIFQAAFDVSDDAFNKILIHRRDEVVSTVLARLQL